MLASCKELRVAESADSEPELPELAPGERQVAQVAQALEHPVWCNQLWAPVRRSHRTIRRSSALSGQSIRPRLWPTSKSMECPCCSSILGKPTSESRRRFRLAAAFRSSSTTTGKQRTVLFLICPLY